MWTQHWVPLHSVILLESKASSQEEPWASSDHYFSTSKSQKRLWEGYSGIYLSLKRSNGCIWCLILVNRGRKSIWQVCYSCQLSTNFTSQTPRKAGQRHQRKPPCLFQFQANDLQERAANSQKPGLLVSRALEVVWCVACESQDLES